MAAVGGARAEQHPHWEESPMSFTNDVTSLAQAVRDAEQEERFARERRAAHSFLRHGGITLPPNDPRAIDHRRQQAEAEQAVTDAQRAVEVARARLRPCRYALSPRQPRSRSRSVRRLPRRGRRGPRPGQPAARRAAAALPRRTARPVAAVGAPVRSRRGDAAHQPTAGSGGKRGSRGLCRCPPWGSRASGTSGSIPRSTSCRSQK